MSGSGMTAGVISVIGDGTYTASPALGPFGNPATATSLAQALFEARKPLVTNSIPPNAVKIANGVVKPGQDTVVDATTSPPTTILGQALMGLAVDVNATAAAIVGYVVANAVANVTTQQLGVMPSSTTAGTPIDHPASPVLVPIK